MEYKRYRVRRNNNTSGATGVSWHARRKMWQARITYNHTTYTLGYFDKFEDAVEVRRKAEQGEIPLVQKRQLKKESDLAIRTRKDTVIPPLSDAASKIVLGKAYYGLVPLKLYWDQSYTPPQWMATCRCDCGRIVPIRAADIGKVKSCGCWKSGQTEALNVWSKLHNTSGVTGVSWLKRRNCWEANLKCRGIKYYLGQYSELREAISVRLEAEKHRADIEEWYPQFVQTHAINKKTIPSREYKPRKSSRGGKQGKEWLLRSPEGQVFRVKNLSQWCTQNSGLFERSQTTVYNAFIVMATQLRRGEPQTPFCGWTLEKLPEYEKKTSGENTQRRETEGQ